MVCKLARERKDAAKLVNKVLGDSHRADVTINGVCWCVPP